MAAINPHLPLSALNDVVRGRPSPDALYEINSASPSEMNGPSLGHQVRDAEWVNSCLGVQEWRFVGLFSSVSMSCNKCLFQLPRCPFSPDFWHQREQSAAHLDILFPLEESVQRSERLIPASRTDAAFKVTFLPGFEPRQSGLAVSTSSVKGLPFHWLITLSRVRSQFPPAELWPCRGQPKLPFKLFFSLMKVKPASNVTTVFAYQRGSVCSSLFSDVDSLIKHNFHSLC